MSLLLLGCDGLRYKIDFYGGGNCSPMVSSSRFECLEVQGYRRVCIVDFGKLVALETLSIRGVQWCWEAISKTQMASEVKHLYMKIEFTGDSDSLQPFT
ncbi:F-box protein at1g10780 [Phtheirospermum japonicum]|uniref:F-box protein at1g10780 n=1 Tax=Phtheirospermum japonicum TaxID=374723 RepID=A0A830CVU3_9LAMI|nr:F-box protein at1g10780 [Phtheirospermum japonicum]